MRFFHLADLHLGKTVHGFSMLREQRVILNKILLAAKEHHPDAVLIAGDVYDRTVAPLEAVELLDSFLTDLINSGIKVFIIAGNHDSPERLRFGSKIMNASGLYIAGTFDGAIEKVTLSDAYGEADVYLLPYIRPASVRRFFDFEITSYQQAVESVLALTPPDPLRRNVLLAHQFVLSGETPPLTSESETLSVGGSDRVSADLFNVFDYVALGHLHAPQRAGREQTRYAGSPLKYSFSEAEHKKSLVMVDMLEKGNVEISFLPLVPENDMREIKGTLEELCAVQEKTNDYIRAVLTDSQELFDPIGKLRAKYPNLMRLVAGNAQSYKSTEETGGDVLKTKTEAELFEEFYTMQNAQALTEEQKKLMDKIIKTVTAGGEK